MRRSVVDFNAIVDPQAIINLELDDKKEKWTSSVRRFFGDRNRVGLMSRVFLKLSCISARSHKVSYAVSFYCVFLVVVLCVILVSTIFHLPLIFLRLGEIYNGQNDLSISPGGEVGDAASLNYSVVELLFPPSDSKRNYHSPRITFTASIVKYSTCSGISNPRDLWFSVGKRSCRKGCVNQHCDGSEFSVRLIAVNLKRERRMGFGSSWKQPPLKKGEVILSKPVAEAANETKVGDTILLSVEFGTPLRALLQNVSSVSIYARTIMTLTVVDIVAPDHTKFEMEDFALMDYDTSVAMIAEGIHPDVDAEEVRIFAKRNPKSAASSIHFNLEPKARIQAYKTTDYSVVRRRISTWVTSIVDPIGYSQLSVNTPILGFLYGIRFLSLFVGLIVSIIVVSLAFLSCVLIYSLLSLASESQIYELGIMRMVGFSRSALACMLLINAYSFTLPAWLAGLIIGQCLYLIIRTQVYNIIGVNMPYIVTGQAIGWASLTGLLLPIIGSIFPVLGIITQKLPDALNANRGRNVGVVYKLERDGDTRKMKYLMFGIGLAFSILGFLLYYFFPVALMRMRLDMLFIIFFGVLLVVLSGLVLLTVNFERVIQTMLSYLFFFWESDAVFKAFQKCLVAHRNRNRKTTLMYAFSVGVFIFIAIAFQVQLRSFYYTTRRSMGADVVIDFENLDLFKYGEMMRYIQSYVTDVSAVAFLSSSLSHKLNVRNVSLHSPGRFQGGLINGFRAISPNYFEFLDRDFLSVSQYDKASEQLSLSGAVYTGERNRVIMSSSVYSVLETRSFDEPVVLSLGSIKDNIKRSIESVRYAVRPSAVLDSAPQVTMSKYRGVNGALLTSLPSLVRLSSNNFLSVRGITISTVSFRVTDNSKLDSVTQSLLKYFRRSRINKFNVRDSGTMSKYMAVAEQSLGFFFIFTQVVTMTICFFSLLASMTANVSESSKEIGIYLCIGMTRFQVHRIFLWEAFIVVISSGVLGLVVGVSVGFMMQLQNQIFSQLEVPFTFPYLQFVVIVTMALGTAWLASYPTVTSLLRLPSITHILRKTT